MNFIIQEKLHNQNQSLRIMCLSVGVTDNILLQNKVRHVSRLMS